MQYSSPVVAYFRRTKHPCAFEPELKVQCTSQNPFEGEKFIVTLTTSNEPELIRNQEKHIDII